jgi:nucleoside-diphosphate-sugar epimerase
VRILVTGAAGFVGAHLANELTEHGHDVVCVDKPEGDLSQPDVARKLIEWARPDYVAHLAARYGRLLCRDEPHRAVADNAAATTEVAAVCAEWGIPVLYTSSSEVYGDHGEALISESSPLHTPTTIYGLSKLWGEEALKLYLPSDDLCIVRMNMLYGPGQQAGYGRCALATFIDDAIQERPLTVHRVASRSWLYITDAVRALRLLIEGGHSGVFNLGNSAEKLSMADLAAMVSEAAPTYAGVRFTDAPVGQIRHKNYDSSKLRAVLGWEPRVALREGIAATMAWQIESQRKAA